VHSRPPICRSSRLSLRGAVWAILLACVSWIVLTLLWSHASTGGLADKIVGSVLSPSYQLGKHLAHICFPNYNSRNATGTYLAPVFGVAAEILFLTALWLLALWIRAWIRTRRMHS
jgi:hypothetical protein